MEEGLTRSDRSETLKWHVHESVTLLRCARRASAHANLSDFEVVMCPYYRSLTCTCSRQSEHVPCKDRYDQETRLLWDGFDQDNK